MVMNGSLIYFVDLRLAVCFFDYADWEQVIVVKEMHEEKSLPDKSAE